jgi:phosphohistidine phosphatase
MPQLLIMRHAKSDWNSPTGDDHERPLAPRGIKAARRMGRLLSGRDAAPELILTSTAVRARTTVELAAEAGGWSCEVKEWKEFYGADPQGVIDRLAETDKLPDRVMIAGHEPTWSSLVGLLTGGGRVRMPTGAVACVEFSGPWSALAPGRCQLQWLVIPRLLKGLI